MKENTFKMFHPYSMWWRRNERYRKFAGMLSWKTLTPRMGGHRRDVRTRARARAYFMRSLARSPRVGPDRRRRCRCRSPCRFFRSGTKERSGPKITQKIGDSGEFFSRPTTDRPIVPTKECSNSKTSLLNRPTAFFSLQIRERTDATATDGTTRRDSASLARVPGRISSHSRMSKIILTKMNFLF